jgi:hypothetical protein
MTPTPMVLIDGWPDGYIEERAWVEVTTATTERRHAIEALEEEMPIADMFPDEPEDGIHYRVTGQEWQRRMGQAVPGHDDLRVDHPLDQYGPCALCKGTGKIEIIAKIEQRLASTSADPATRLAAPASVAYMTGLPCTEMNLRKIERANGVVTRREDEECCDCHGTGKEADWIHGDEGWPYEKCEEGDEDAMLFWTISVSNEPDPSVNVSDEQTTLPES